MHHPTAPALARKSPVLARLVLAASLLLAFSQAEAALSFQVKVLTHTEAAKAGDVAPGDTSETLKVALGERYAAVSSADRIDIYDFATRRRYQVDLKSARYVEYSLYDSVGMRVMELQNRQGLAKIMAAAKIDSGAFDSVYDEQALSVASATPRTLKQAAQGTGALYSIEGNALASTSAGGTRLNPADAKLFTRFLRYQFGGHPALLTALGETGQLPAHLVMHYRQVGRAQLRTIDFDAVAPSAPASYDLKPYTPRSAENDQVEQVDQVLDRAQAMAPTPMEANRQRFTAAIDSAFAQKRNLDAMLGILEWNLMSGEPPPPFSEARKQALQGDAGVGALMAAMNPNTKPALQESVRILQQARPQTMERQHMLKLFEANNRVKLGEGKAALELFTSVLRANPALAGAYKDMGDDLFSQFDMARAWRSWDAGRRLAPKLSLFEAVDQFEQKLLREHPEYF